MKKTSSQQCSQNSKIAEEHPGKTALEKLKKLSERFTPEQLQRNIEADPTIGEHIQLLEKQAGDYMMEQQTQALKAVSQKIGVDISPVIEYIAFRTSSMTMDQIQQMMGAVVPSLIEEIGGSVADALTQEEYSDNDEETEEEGDYDNE